MDWRATDGRARSWAGRAKWMLAWLATAVASAVLAPAEPSQADGTFFMTGDYEVANGFANRRRIRGFQDSVVTTDPSGMGAISIEPGVFSITGSPVIGKQVAEIACGGLTQGAALGCMLQFGARGFQAFPGFPVFAQNASTFTEVNTSTGMLGPGSGPGSFSFCPLVGNPANGTGVPNCPGLGNGSPAGVQGIMQYFGGNGYGGTMAILRDSIVTVAQRRSTNPTIFQFDQEVRTGFWPHGVPMSYTYTTQPEPGPQTRSPVLGVFSSIQTAGPVVGQGTNVLSSTSTGFPWTTGMMRGAEDSCVQAGTCGTGNQFVQFTLTGSDARGADGQGTLSLVSGGMLQNRDGLSTVNHAGLRLTLTLPEPGTALGLGAGGLLMLGLARRRS